MPREPILSAAVDRDEEFDSGLGPQRIKDMVGQRDVIERLNIVVDAARKRGEPLGLGSAFVISSGGSGGFRGSCAIQWKSRETFGGRPDR